MQISNELKTFSENISLRRLSLSVETHEKLKNTIQLNWLLYRWIFNNPSNSISGLGWGVMVNYIYFSAFRVNLPSYSHSATRRQQQQPECSVLFIANALKHKPKHRMNIKHPLHPVPDCWYDKQTICDQNSSLRFDSFIYSIRYKYIFISILNHCIGKYLFPSPSLTTGYWRHDSTIYKQLLWKVISFQV